MRVAVAGSSGVIGTALKAALAERGDDVLSLRRPQSGGRGVAWDPEDGTIDARPLHGLDAVINLAGRSIGERRWTKAEKNRLWSSRVNTAQLLARTLAGMDERPAVMINASAVGYYGNGGDTILAEDAPEGSGYLAGLCAAWEGATEPAVTAGIRVVNLRSGIVLSAAGGALGRLLAPFGPRWISPFRWGLGGPVGGGRQWWSWISLNDEVRAILHALDTGISGPVNLVAPNPVTNREFTKVLGRVLRRPAVLPLPAFVLRLMLGAELAEALVLDGQRAAPTVLVESGFQFEHSDVETALRSALGAR